MTGAGRVLSKPSGDGFSARSWLENDGDIALQETASARAGLRASKGAVVFQLDGLKIVQLRGRGVLDRIGAACRDAGMVIVTREVPRPMPCVVVDSTRLRRTGALAVYSERSEFRLVGAREQGGQRLWSGQ